MIRFVIRELAAALAPHLPAWLKAIYYERRTDAHIKAMHAVPARKGRR